MSDRVEPKNLPRGEQRYSGKGLKADAVGFWDGVSIGLDSTAPAYSIAAVLGSIVIVAGVKAPAVLLVSFIPMFFIAGAFYYMNRADQDAGTTFSWVTRAMGPWMGWMGGWAVFTTGVLVIGAQADVGARYTYLLLGLDDLAANKWAVVALAVVMILVLTWICVIGTELSASVQRALVLAQCGILLVFVLVAGWQMVRGDVAADAPSFGLDWLNPIGLSGSALIAGMLLGVFCYWGWESAVNLTEETRDSETAPGKAAVVSTILLLVIYIGSAIAIIGVLGLGVLEEFDDDEGLFLVVGDQVLGGWSWLLVLAIITSTVAATQTTILPASRTSLSMAVAGAFPKRFATVDPEHGTPGFGTWVIGIVAIVWYVLGSAISENFLFDSLSALSIVVAFYYALTGIACAIYWRRELRRSVRAFIMIGLAPVIGAIVLLVLLVAAVIDYADPENSYTQTSILGMGAPLAMAIIIFVVGLVLMFISWRASGGGGYFERTGGEEVSDDVARAALGPVAPGR
ncbi:APC family permease [Janibacter sp. GXQ6167]|uniref:APC family permease n=1 Tax=Janibacter sp. GXQ6167 TaxID=3240791 RepID=UPI0035267163